MRRVSLSLALAAALAISASACSGLDRRSFAGTPAYGEAMAIASARGSAATRGAGPLLAGWSREEIRAPKGVPLAGYGAREGGPSTGVHDPVFVRAFALQRGAARVVVITADLLLLDPGVAAAIRRAVADVLAPGALFFTASHTHSGPGGYARGIVWSLAFGPYDARAFEAVVDAHARAIRSALEDLAPARVGSSTIEVRGLTRNRVERDGPTDDVLLAVFLEHEGRGDSAVLWSFGCHAVTLGPDNREISADYPGAVARAFEGGAHAVVGFAAGGVGSTEPRRAGRDAPWLVAPLVSAVHQAVDRARGDARREGTLAWASAEVPLPEPRYRVRGAPVPAPLVRAFVGAEIVTFGAVAIGDLLLLHVPAELSGELTAHARARFAASGVRLAVLPFDGSYAGYVVPERVYDLPPSRREAMHAYETETASFFGPRGADLIMNVALRLGSGVLHARAATHEVSTER